MISRKIGLVMMNYLLFRLHRSLQKTTRLQFSRHFFRQEKGLPHTGHVFVGRCCLKPFISLSSHRRRREDRWKTMMIATVVSIYRTLDGVRDMRAESKIGSVLVRLVASKISKQSLRNLFAPSCSATSPSIRIQRGTQVIESSTSQDSHTSHEVAPIVWNS